MKTISRPGVARPVLSATVLACAILTGVAFAASEDGHREHEAHEHGRGMLDIVAEGEELVVEFRIPAANVVGFEHAPRDDAEHEAVRMAAETFRDPASVLALPAEAECEVEEAEAGIVGMGAEEHDDDHAHEGEDHDEDEHAKEEHEEEGEDHEHAKEEHEEEGEGHDHAKEEHEEEGEGHDHAKEEHEEEGEGHDHAKEEHDEHDEHSADSDGEAHSELRATYHFHCHAPDRLVRIEVGVFEHLRDAEEIDVRVVTATAQTAMELHPGETVVELSR